MPRVAPLFIVMVAAACGKKLPPQPPLQVVPARVAPLRLTQEEADVVLRFPYPAKTAQGEDLTGLTKATVYREILPAREGMPAPPPPADGATRDREEKAFLSRAEAIRTLTRGEIDDATVGSDVVVRDSLYPLYKDKRLGRIFLRYAVTATRDKKRTSALSPLVSIAPRVPPGPALFLRAVVEEKRVCLDWLPPQAMLDGGKPAVVAGYAVYRRRHEEDEYDQPVGVTGIPLYVDETIETGVSYLYTVRAAPTAQVPYVLGPPADEVLVDTKDVFPPAVPEAVIVLAEEGGNRIVWNPSLAPDLAGYRVYRWDPAGAKWTRIADALRDPSLFDPGGPSGTRYGVAAFDRSGNESEKGEPQKEKSGP